MTDMNARPETRGRVMALDLGEKRIGIAISDELRMVAKPYGVIRRKSRRKDYETYGRIIEENQIALLIIGLPITLGESEGQKAKWVRDYALELGTQLTIPMKFWDESLTTVDAQANLKARGYGRQRIQAKVDAVAAAYILQSYLDSERQTGLASEQDSR